MSHAIRIFFTASFLIFSSVLAFSGPRPKTSDARVYKSRNTEGLIGTTKESPADNPADNIFHVQVDQKFCSEDQVWLEYELEGVEDHSSVARSINDHLAVGGHIVKKRRGWALQQERIDGSWLSEGDNVIRFTLPVGAQHSYRIRNLKVIVKPNTQEEEIVIVNQPSKNYYDKTAYVKGFIPEGKKENTQLKIAGKLVPVFKGEFEGEVSMVNSDCNVEMELIFADGTTQCQTLSFERMESADFHYAINSNVFYKEQFIEQSKADSVSLQGSNLKLPSGALDNSSSLSITTLRDIDIPALDAGMVNVTAYHFGYRFLPHGTKFHKEAKLKIPFDGTKIPDGYTDKDIRTYYFDEQTHHWIALNSDTLLASTNEVVSRIVHFTDYINAIIKVPESPEVEAYNSTSMKGIKAANPTAAVNLINPPQANNTGSASLSYPINIPAGRNGMQPQLAISYNSAGGNGWLGLGWNLMTPSVGIETRWGVPRYDPAKETETYSMNGEMLTPVAHRGTLAARSTGDKQFYPRVEGAFHRIIRHGNDPKSYWWEVTDKSGTRFFYGGSPETQLDKTAVLRDDEGNDAGNVAHWALTETRDLNGNFVKYHYAKVSSTGLTNGTVPGYQLYIDNITYTGHNGAEGNYKVVFTRQQGRTDVTIAANLGFKEVTADLLQKIDVQFQNNSVRSYVLNYQTGEFYKSLLSTISEYDAKGNLFNSHTFDYYDDVKSGGTFSPMEQNKSWTIPYDRIRNTEFVTNKENFSSATSALSGTKSSDWSAGLSASVAIGDENPACKTFSIGGNYTYSHSSSESLLSMMDINGDGLSDKVFISNTGLNYYPNLGQGEFGNTVKSINGIQDLYLEKSSSNNAGFEAQAGCKSYSAVINAGVNWSTSTTSAYFTDVNGDQLPDLVKNGIVQFNHVDPETGAITFQPTSGGTPSPIVTGGTLTDIVTQTAAERQTLNNQYPLHDVVKIWQAPYSGVVSVYGTIQLVPSTDPSRNDAHPDGVRVAIQLREAELWTVNIGPDDYSAHSPSGVTNLTVNKGDRLFFRVGSIDNGLFDQVKWNPVVEYNDQDVTLNDANGKPLYHFEASKDFILASTHRIAGPVSGTINITGTFVKPQTSDDVMLTVIHNANDTIIKKNYKWSETVNEPVLLNGFHLLSEETLIFRVSSSTNIDWSAIQWRPHIVYTAADDPSTDVTSAPIEVFPVPQFTLFAYPIQKSTPWKLTEKVDTLKVRPRLSFNSVGPIGLLKYSGTINFSVKKLDTLVTKGVLVINEGVIVSGDSVFKVPSKKGSTYFFEYNSADPNVFKWLSNAATKVSGLKKDSTVNSGFYSALPDNNNSEDIIFGPLYRGWGHFAWRANGDTATAPLNQNLFKLNDALTKPQDVNSVSSPSDLGGSNGTYDPSKDQFIMLVAMGKDQLWQGYDQYTYVTADVISSSRMGEDDLSAPVANSAGAGAMGVNKISKTFGTSFSAGGGGGKGFSANGSYSWSDGNTRVVADFMDMNGDRFPDIVTENKIQYTMATGGLEPNARPQGQPIQNTVTHSEGVTVSGSALLSESKPNTFNIKKVKVSVGSGKASAGLNGNFAKGDNQSSVSWMDINGDGLPDRVNNLTKTVALNLGYSFAQEEPWNFDAIQSGSSSSESAGLGISFGNGSFSAGIGLAKSSNFIANTLHDINGDGLLDMISQGDPLQVRLNTGNGFAAPMAWTGASRINDNTSVSESANLGFTIGIDIPPPIAITIYINPSGSVGQGMSRELSRFMDIDGDGFPDYLQSSNDGELFVSRSTIGRTNLLKGVQRPLGASFTMNYHRMGNTYNLPHSVWVVDSVRVFDGFKGDGADEMLTTFTYNNGVYDRNERENYGFATVTTQTHDTQNNNLPYTIVTQTYLNTNYYNKGLLISETMTDLFGKKYVVKTNSYDLKDITTGDNLPPMALTDSGNAFPALVNTVQQFFEGQSSPGKTTSMQYGYDVLGNVTTYTDNGDVGTEDDLNATIAYHNLTDKYIVGTPKSIVVNNGSAVLRKRESVIDQSTGEVTQIKQYLDDQNIAVHDMQYDSYGNLVKMTRPANSTGQRLSINYTYDATVDTYPIQVSNSYGYSSSATYDFRFGEKLSSTDLNGNQIIYTLDDLGRVVQILGPYENGGGSTSNYTIKFEYHPEAVVPYALTNHFDPQNPKNDLQTSIFVDGLGRVLQTKKDVAMFTGDGKADTEMMTVSGRVLFDPFGRTIKAYYPTTEATGSAGTFNKAFDSVKPTTTTYDVLNRTLTVTLPDSAVTKTEYGFDSDRDGNQQFSTKTTDANGKQTEQFTDVRGRVTSVKNFISDSPVWTSFKYNAINEQIEATDDLKHTTFSTYDNLGRRTTRKHPDAGTTTYSYDLAGNLNTLVTANLAAAGMSINYTYDFERLTQITYPQNPENNVKYTYGAAGASDNQAGRIVLQEDATGAQEFFYGKLGEVVKNVRTIIIPQQDPQTFITQWTYDTWNRLTSMVYPDGETVTYNYNAGGLLHDMGGKKTSSNFAYVNQLGYDKFEQRVFLAYGNGTKTTYTYEEDRRRLKSMTAQTSAQRSFMDNVYTYDKVNNILDLTNKAPVPNANLMGGPSEYKYSYDDLYRLTSANGNYKGANDEESYTLAMSYNSVGGILSKNQNHLKKGVTEKKTTYNNSYKYGDNQPHAPIHIGTQSYTYDANGNQLGWKDDVTGQKRNIVWDEENRIRAIEDNGAYFHYVYDASGERVLKGQSSGQRIFVNGNWKGGGGQMGNYTVYVNPYIVLKSGGYTKHFYIEGQRIVSKLGGGWDNNGKGPLKQAGNGKIDFNAKTQQLSDGIVKNLKFLGADGQILTAGKSGKVPPGQVNGTGNIAEAFRYFFHPDHLGSTSYVTDASGEVYQHLEYFAFGETFVDEHSNTNKTPYLFNGKELDEETGLYYYGARYYDARTSVWEGVDIESDKYSGLSPFNYSLNNPLNATDPDGRLVIFINGFWGRGTGACCGGNKEYWSFAGGGGGWANDAMNAIGDHNARYYDGSSGGLWRGNPQYQVIPRVRYSEGYKMGTKDAEAIVNSLARDANDPNHIVESIKFVTNSMGAAYERGFSQALSDYVTTYNNNARAHNEKEMQKAKLDPNYKPNLKQELTGFEIESNVDLAAFQGKGIPADQNAKSNYFMRSKQDIVAGYEGAAVPGATELGRGKSKGHHASFFPAGDLPKSGKPGKTVQDINQN